jgi:DNA mismatch repair protein MutL
MAVGRVRILPDDLANQIAAGEVVERPASVIKELCENALDASATRIDIAIEGGGITLASVTDDGVGMIESDLLLSMRRHATSKIASLDDLLNIGSFGFRGEALPSIASVSRFSIASRDKQADAGAELVIEGGGEPQLKPRGMPAGTRVSVRDLFFNVPARRKFLRALATEAAHVTEVVEGVALAEPGITLTLARDGRVVREHLRAPDRETRVNDVLVGWELAHCKGERGPLKVEAFLSRPEKARMGANGLRILVNGRPIRDRALARAVAHAYGSVLAPGRYPVGVVYLTIPPDLVDVNVHPQKAEVRFADGRAVQDALYRIVETGLGAAFTRQVGLGFVPSPSRQTFGGGHDAPANAASFSASGALDDAAIQALAGEVQYPTRELDAPPLSTDPGVVLPEVEFIAQVRGMFLLCQSEEGLVILDQHAAAERLTFERLKRTFRERRVAMQTMLVPEVLDVTPADVALVEELGDTILAMGMDLRPAGTAKVAVYAVPHLVVRASPAELARALLGELGRAGGRDYSSAVDLVLATMACHGSIRAGDRVSPEEARELVRELAKIDFAGHCPHGRPIVMRLSYRELEHRVGRR